MKKPSISSQDGLSSERTTRGSANAISEKIEIAPSEPKPSWLTMSPPSPVISAPAGWKGRKDTRTTVNSSAAIAVATPSRVKAALSGARSVLLRLAVLLIGISEFGKHAAECDMDGV